jgi:hypothetical protein
MTALVSRSAVLVTGMSGTGKSTALAELGRRGHRILDTDDPGWIVPVEASHGIEPMWDLDRVAALLDGHRAGWLFVSGCVANQGALYERFDAVVLLSAPLDVILDCVGHRANPFRSRPEIARRSPETWLHSSLCCAPGADHEIATTAPVAEVVAKLEHVAAAVAARAHRSR